MPRNITVTFADGTTHVYQNAPDNVTPQQVSQRAQREFGKQVHAFDGGRQSTQQRPSAPPKAKPRPQPSPAQQIGASIMNPLAGLAQGASSIADVTADAIGGALRLAGRPVTSGLSAAAEAIGADGAARSIRQTGAQWERAMARPFTIGSAIERAAPTPQSATGKGIRIASQLVGGSLIPIPTAKAPAKLPTARPASANPAREIVQEGQRAGVRVMTSDVRPPRTFVGKNAQGIGEKIPLIGTGGTRAAQQGERVEAVKTVLRDFGGDDAVALFDDAPGAIEDVAKSLKANRSAQLSKLTAVKRDIIERFPDPVPVPQTMNAIDAQIARLKGLKSAEYAPIIAKLEDWKTSIQGQNLDNIEELRKMMGKAFDGDGLASIKDVGQKAFNAIYGPMKADMGNFIRTKGGQQAYNMWRQSNDRLAAMAGELNATSLKSVLRTADMTPENVGKLLFSAKPSDVRLLYTNLDDFGKTRAQSALLQRAFDRAISANEGLSVERFLNNVNSLGGNIGVTFKGADRARIEGLVRLLDATRRASAAAAAPPTGVQNQPAIIGYSLGTLFGQAAIPIAAAGGVVARVYESPAVRDLLLKLGRTKAGSAAEASLMPRVVTAIGTQIERIAPSMNDNFAAPMAASSPSGENSEQQQIP